ncbi:FAD-dependent oxidoreductase [Caenimonas terrae]|uniref:FAD-dependent oxidoreductase n=1 Tax=Caenimonas terrae TaxID=696074 RepID=A0ABW0NIV4_9BURK
MKDKASIGIAGAGLLGRLLAWQLARAGHRVGVFDPAADALPTFDGRQAAGFTAAGMLSPLAELDTSSTDVAALGWRSIALWRAIVAQLQAPPQFSTEGSLLLAHRSDAGSAQRVLARLAAAPAGTAHAQPLSMAQLAQLEPALHGAAHAWFLPGEGQIDPVAALLALHAEAPAVQWNWGQAVESVAPGTLLLQDGSKQRFDLVFDVRGTGGRPELPVRGVRGETVWLHAPGHGLTRPVRLLHPRHRVYLVPRPGDVVLVGASEIESEDRSPVSLRSAVELMSAAHSVLPALAEARIQRLDVNLRPALPDNEPHIESASGLVRINGLFRHGWLIAPALVEDALRQCGLAPRQTAELAHE